MSISTPLNDKRDAVLVSTAPAIKEKLVLLEAIARDLLSVDCTSALHDALKKVCALASETNQLLQALYKAARNVLYSPQEQNVLRHIYNRLYYDYQNVLKKLDAVAEQAASTIPKANPQGSTRAYASHSHPFSSDKSNPCSVPSVTSASRVKHMLSSSPPHFPTTTSASLNRLGSSNRVPLLQQTMSLSSKTITAPFSNEIPFHADTDYQLLTAEPLDDATASTQPQSSSALIHAEDPHLSQSSAYSKIPPSADHHRSMWKETAYDFLQIQKDIQEIRKFYQHVTYELHNSSAGLDLLETNVERVKQTTSSTVSHLKNAKRFSGIPYQIYFLGVSLMLIVWFLWKVF